MNTVPTWVGRCLRRPHHTTVTPLRSTLPCQTLYPFKHDTEAPPSLALSYYNKYLAVERCHTCVIYAFHSDKVTFPTGEASTSKKSTSCVRVPTYGGCSSLLGVTLTSTACTVDVDSTYYQSARRSLSPSDFFYGLSWTCLH